METTVQQTSVHCLATTEVVVERQSVVALTKAGIPRIRSAEARERAEAKTRYTEKFMLGSTVSVCIW